MAAALLFSAGCLGSLADPTTPLALWGRRGVSDGRFQKPRAVTIDAHDRLYIVDMTARIQAFDADGKFLRAWRTPESKFGRPTGLAVGRGGEILVADTHYFRVLGYSNLGELLWQLGGTEGHGPGEFGFVTDVVQDADGNYYVGEYGEYDRIQKFAPDRTYLLEWGGHGSKPGQFQRPQSLVFDREGLLWVADACNHRLQVFDNQGRLVKLWGQHGSGPGQLAYPYDLAFNQSGELYVCEFGNHRVQKFTRDGQSLGTWGQSGRQPGQFYNPWGLVCDSQGRLDVLDSNNHRVQQIQF